nr:polysaccharide biosynthesis protein [Propionibacterium sp.]
MPFLLMPIIGLLVGPEGWSSAIAGQSIGTIASVLVLWGWNVDGTVQIAQAATEDARAEVYARSMRTRLLLSVVVLPAAVVVAALVARPGFVDEAAAMTLAYGLLGLSPAWYGIGAGRPLLLGLYDTLPRFAATVASAPLLLATRSLWPFPLLMAASTAVALGLFQRRFAPGRPWFPRRVGQALADLAGQRHTAGINLAGQVYAQTPTPIATATLPALASGPLATTDALYRLGLFSAVALGNAFQGWTLEPGVADRRRRHLAAIAAHAALGVAGVVVLVVLGPPISPLLSADAAPATATLCLAYGLAFAFLSAATPLIRNLLIPAGRQPLVLRATVAAALLGLGVMLGSGLAGWVEGVAFGMAASELAMLLMLTPPALRVLRSIGAESGRES